MPSKRKCSYCEATTDPKKSLVDQDWISVQLWVEDNNGKTQQFAKRACPIHRETLLQKASEFIMMEGHPPMDDELDTKQEIVDGG